MRPVSCREYETTELRDGWELAGTAAGAHADASDLNGLDWSPASVPGTVAGSLAGLPPGELDSRDWWFRVRLDVSAPGVDEELVLILEGVATIAEIYLDGERRCDSESMFARHRLPLTGAVRELVICCRALTPELQRRRRPRARWRTKLVAEGNLRFHRTMLLGRIPGVAPGPAVVGPWRPVRLERRRLVAADSVRMIPRVDPDGTGALDVSMTLRAIPPVSALTELTVALRRGTQIHEQPLTLQQGGVAIHASGTVRVPSVERWWPHTHGEPALYEVTVHGAGATLELGTVGFRDLDAGADPERHGLALRVNGAPVFVRGAVWTPLSLEQPHAEGERLDAVLHQVRRAGLNLLRIPGTGCYESDAFLRRCDELGLLVWQDFMFANLDYPDQEPDFMAVVSAEAEDQLSRWQGRPSLAVLCGGSEVAQQVAMLGLDPALADGPLYRELLPGHAAAAGLDAAYLPSAPCGGELPFRNDVGVANYFGVGGYRRGLADARLAGVRFASECLAFANVPDEAGLSPLDGGGTPSQAAWKAGVPRDPGVSWDFDDVRDHYLGELFGVDPVALRSSDPERYLDLSRAVSGEVMAEVFGEWRRAGSPSQGAVVLWLTDLVPGAGWGLLDHRGAPKPVMHRLRQALAPVSVWSTDEGLGGIAAHVANDAGYRLDAELRISLYRDLEQRVLEAVVPVGLGPHDTVSVDVESALGRFVDVSWAYRFGPPGQDLVVLTLSSTDGRLLSQSFRHPVGRPLRQETARHLGLVATPDGDAQLTVGADRFVYGVQLDIPGFTASEQWFSVEPGHSRTIALERRADHHGALRGRLQALNLTGWTAIG